MSQNNRLQDIKDRILGIQETGDTLLGCKCKGCTSVREAAAGTIAGMLLAAWQTDQEGKTRDGHVSIVTFAIIPPAMDCPSRGQEQSRASVLKMLLLPGSLRSMDDVYAIEHGMPAAFEAISSTAAKHIGATLAMAVADGKITKEDANRHLERLAQDAAELERRMAPRKEPPPSAN